VPAISQEEQHALNKSWDLHGIMAGFGNIQEGHYTACCLRAPVSCTVPFFAVADLDYSRAEIFFPKKGSIWAPFDLLLFSAVTHLECSRMGIFFPIEGSIWVTTFGLVPF
jgi:hypothetical protein